MKCKIKQQQQQLQPAMLNVMNGKGRLNSLTLQ